jgi:hypothetical protein
MSAPEPLEALAGALDLGPDHAVFDMIVDQCPDSEGSMAPLEDAGQESGAGLESLAYSYEQLAPEMRGPADDPKPPLRS